MISYEYLNKRNNFEIKEIYHYLEGFGVNFDNPAKTVIAREDGKIVGTGSVDGKVMKYFFIEEGHKGEGILPKIYEKLLDYLFETGATEHFVFTKPLNRLYFEGLGLSEVWETDNVLLLEGGFSTYESWVNSVKKKLNPEVIKRGTIVANCNPMTLGHKYLMEYAARQVDELVIFIVEEDKSIFPTDDRFKIVESEFKNRNDIVVVKGGPYIISQATFPTYFIKKLDDATKFYAELDAEIFSGKIAKDLEIDIRFVGEEPLDKLTNEYNKKLRKSTIGKTVELEMIPRLEEEGNVISASYVRKLLKEAKYEEAFKMVPKCTEDFLKSEEGLRIIKKIQEEDSNKWKNS